VIILLNRYTGLILIRLHYYYYGKTNEPLIYGWLKLFYNAIIPVDFVITIIYK
jgi:hypothetical protein